MTDITPEDVLESHVEDCEAFSEFGDNHDHELSERITIAKKRIESALKLQELVKGIIKKYQGTAMIYTINGFQSLVEKSEKIE